MQGHGDAVWGYTPRQTFGHAELIERQRRRDLAATLAIETLAARGDDKAISRALRDLAGS